MKRRTGHPPGWVPFKSAQERTGLSEGALRGMIQDGHFTGLRRTPGKTSALFIPEREVVAFERGGVDALQAVRSAPVAAGA